MSLDVKKDFAIFKSQKKLAYLDNAATSMTPDCVVKAMDEYYENYNSNVHRGVYKIARMADEKYEGARKFIADYINADVQEVIFTSGATFGLNILAYSLSRGLNKGDNVVLSRMEHHANLVPWQQAARRHGFELRFIELGDDYDLDMNSARKVIDQNTKVVSIVHVSNTLGTINPVKQIIALAKKVGAKTILDSAQAAAHIKIDVEELDCDFLVFSGHKVFGPTGIGVLYGRKRLLLEMEPLIFGGDMISLVTYERSEWNELPWKFEAGTPNISGAIGMAEGLRYLGTIGYNNLSRHEEGLTRKAVHELSKIEGVKLIGPKYNRIGVVSFVIDGIHPHDIATILDEEGVAVRAGHHCTMPLMKLLGVKATVRASFSIYNEEKDVDSLVRGVNRAIKVFKK